MSFAKTEEPIQMPWVVDPDGPKEPCGLLSGGPDPPPQGKGQFGVLFPPTEMR